MSAPQSPYGFPLSNYPARVFENIDAAKWERIKLKIKQTVGIDMNTPTNMGYGSAKGMTIYWCYAPETHVLATDLFKRSFVDPSAQEIDHRLADWINAA